MGTLPKGPPPLADLPTNHRRGPDTRIEVGAPVLWMSSELLVVARDPAEHSAGRPRDTGLEKALDVAGGADEQRPGGPANAAADAGADRAPDGGSAHPLAVLIVLLRLVRVETLLAKRLEHVRVTHATLL